MSIVCALPFVGGIVVAADRSYLDQERKQSFGDCKLALAGGVLFSLTGQTRARERESGRSSFSLQDTIAAQAPARLEGTHLPQLVDEIDRAWQRQGATGKVVGFFYWPGIVFSLELAAGRRPQCAPAMIRRTDTAPFMFHGREEASQVLASGSLSASSRALLARKPLVRDVTRAEAVAFVLDFQAAAARHVPQAIGGGVDVRVVTPAGVEEVAA